jgi:Spy/CpxP family protein refolding chaperone
MNSKFLAALAIAFTLPAWSAEPPAKAQSATLTTPATPDDEQVVAEFRKELMAKRADIMAKGLTLTSEQAAKFWPLFDQFQKEQDVVVNEQIKATDEYAKHFQTLTEPEALAYVNALLARDKKMYDLRLKWLAKFQAVMPTAMAARAIQLDRRLGNITQVQLSQRIPLIH